MNDEKIKEYPRPDFERENWASLDGAWGFAFDDGGTGEKQGWPFQGELPLTIQVPYAYQTNMSGLGDTATHELVWYKKDFDLPKSMEGKRAFLRFGAADYEAKVWLNGVCLGEHRGGYTPFDFEITREVKVTGNRLAVKITDRADTAQPRGKQYWKDKPDRCWYTPTTGIWQSVWLEAVQGTRLLYTHMTPDIDTNTLLVQASTDRFAPGDSLTAEISYKDRLVKKLSVSLDGIRTSFVISLKEEDAIDEVHYWTPGAPNLYDVAFTLVSEGVETDKAKTYFGMRKITIDGGRIMLNHRPCYLKMILDQGYWRESGLTPPSGAALKRDIELTLEMGFNGARKHQKIEDPRYYYWADRLGLLVWGEMPSGYEFCDAEIANLTRDFEDFVQRDYNHPCIIVWVPLNESWGVRKMLTSKSQQAFGRAMYHFAHALDNTRVISTNDGWENVETDIVGLHDYACSGREFTDKYTPEAMSLPEGIYPMSRRLFANDEKKPDGSVFMVTEYGGIALQSSMDDGNWGYCGAARDEDEFLKRYADVTGAILRLPDFAGFCYTQLTDVYQEVNGLLDDDHEPKFDCKAIRLVNENK